jgi:hypothetical protein
MLKLSGPLASIPGLCAANPSEALIQRIVSLLPKTMDDWEQWLQCVKHNRVETQVLSSITKNNLAAPRWVVAALEDRTNTVRLQNRLRRTNFLRLLAVLREKNVPVILLKGNAIAKEIYGDYDYKQMNDMDLLFKRESLDLLQAIYKEQNYLTIGALGKNPRDQEKFSHHWPMYFNRDLTLFLGTHWNLINPLSKIKIDPNDLWSRAEPLFYEGYEILRLCKEDFLHHLCIHLSPYKVGAKELADIYNSLAYWKSLNWSLFDQIVADAQSYDSVYRALSLSQALMFLNPVQEFLDSIRIKVSPAVLNEVEKRLDVAETILHTRTNHISKIEKTYALFSLTENPIEKTYLLGQMWKLYLFPPLSDAAHLCFEIEPTFKLKQLICRIKAPFIISQAFANDLGWKVFVLVTLSHQWNALKAWFLFLTQFRFRGLNQKAKDLGINLQQLRTIAALD